MPPSPFMNVSRMNIKRAAPVRNRPFLFFHILPEKPARAI